MTSGSDKRGSSDGEPEPTVIDEELSKALSSAMNGDGPFAARAPEAEEPESDGQETLVWESSILTAEQYAGVAEHTEVAPPERYSDEATRALDPLELEEMKPPHVNSMSYVDPRAWFLGRSFGGFRVVCEIASGGMATVFLGRKEGPARVSKHAAVKVVHPHLAYEREFVDMFLDEARIAACVNHPNVCRVLDFGMAEGTYYLAMEYLLGETWSSVRAALAEHADGRRMLPTIAAYVVAQACEGLHAAHEAADDEGRHLGIVHRDVSPQNIFVAYDGTVRVLDFGIARAADRITSTRDGMLKGRLAYMSPEQMANEPIMRAADIWSIGVVLREAIEGKRLFRRGTDAETMLAVTTEPLPAWSTELPPKLQGVVERALQRSPAQRYMTAHDMALDLSRFVSTERRTVNTSELSSWMKQLFASQIEQKRALLQLPIPPPQGDSLAHPQAMASAPHESKSGTNLLQDLEQVHAEQNKPRRRLSWLNLSALLALGSLGAASGIVLGKLLGGHKEKAAVVEVARGESVPREPRAERPPPTAPREVAPAAAPSASPTVESLAPAPASAPPTPASIRSRARGQTSPEPGGSSSESGKASAEPTGAPGTVVVAFEGGWAEVYQGERLLGTTPGRFSLPSGTQALTIKPFGTGKPFVKRAEVKAGEVTKLFLSAE